MSDADVDLLIFFVIIGAAVAVCSALMCGIYRLIVKIQDCNEARRSRETIAAVKLYYAVKRRVPGELMPAEYDRAIRYTVQKYHMADRHGGLDMHRQDPEYIAELIAKAVGQDRLSRGTLAIAEADRDLDREAVRNQMKGEKTA